MSRRVPKILREFDLSTSGLDGSALKLQPSEVAFLLWAADRGILMQRNGWPDFACISPRTGKLAGIEVKRSAKDPLSKAQKTCFAMLENAGVDVFVWTQADQSMVPWRRHGETQATAITSSSEKRAQGRAKARKVFSSEMRKIEQNEAADQQYRRFEIKQRRAITQAYLASTTSKTPQ